MTKEQDSLFQTVLNFERRWACRDWSSVVSYDASNEDLTIWNRVVILFLLNMADTLPSTVTREDLLSWGHSFMTLKQFDTFLTDLKELDKFVMHHLHFESEDFIRLFRKEIAGRCVLTRQFWGRLDYLICLVTNLDSSSIAALHQICCFAERITVNSYPGVDESTLAKWKANYEFLLKQEKIASPTMVERVTQKFEKYDFWSLFSPHHSSGSVLEKTVDPITGRRRRLTRQEKYLYTNGPITRYFQRKAGIQSLPAPFVKELSTDTTSQMYVPKGIDSRRIVEPECCERVFNQHGIAEAINFVLEREYGKIYHRRDSSYNEMLALKGSKTGSYDTIDISSASDSVRWVLIESLFANLRPWSTSLRIARSRFSVLMDGTKVPKLAVGSMGSPVTFPLETLVFAELIKEAATELGSDPNNVYFLVYGDDLVVPSWLSKTALQLLTEYGFQPNMNKTFMGEELFRESCGTDAVLGVDITPVRISRFWSVLDKKDAQSVASNVDLANRSFGRLPLVRWYLIRSFEQAGLHLPYSEDRTGLVLKSSHPSNLHLKEGKYDENLQYRTLKCHTLSIEKEPVGLMPPELSYWEWLQQTERRKSPPSPTTQLGANTSLDVLLDLPKSVLSSVRCRSCWVPDTFT